MGELVGGWVGGFEGTYVEVLDQRFIGPPQLQEDVPAVHVMCVGGGI